GSPLRPYGSAQWWHSPTHSAAGVSAPTRWPYAPKHCVTWMPRCAEPTWPPTRRSSLLRTADARTLVREADFSGWAREGNLSAKGGGQRILKGCRNRNLIEPARKPVIMQP